MQRFWLIIFLFFSMIPMINLGSKDEFPTKRILQNSLAHTVKASKPGDTILVTNSVDIQKTLILEGYGSSDRPIVIRAINTGQVYLKNGVVIKGKHLVLEGFVFSEIKATPSLKIIGGQHITIKNNLFDSCGTLGSNSGVLVVNKGSSDNTIVNNTWYYPLSRAIRLLDPLTSKRNRVERNKFLIIPRPKRSNGRAANDNEVIQLGNSQKPSIFEHRSIIVNNFFYRYRGDGSEVISVKSSRNIISRNILYYCKGDITLRRGNFNKVANNFMLGSGGVRVYGNGHDVSENIIIRPRKYGLELGFGDRDSAKYSAASAVTVRKNIISDPKSCAISFGSNRNAHGGHPIECQKLKIYDNSFYLTKGQRSFENKPSSVYTKENNIYYEKPDSLLSQLDTLSALHIRLNKRTSLKEIDSLFQFIGCSFFIH